MNNLKIRNSKSTEVYSVTFFSSLFWAVVFSSLRHITVVSSFLIIFPEVLHTCFFFSHFVTVLQLTPPLLGNGFDQQNWHLYYSESSCPRVWYLSIYSSLSNVLKLPSYKPHVFCRLITMCSLFVAVVNDRFLPWSVVLLDSPAEDRCGLSQDPSTLAMVISFCVIISRRCGDLRTSNSLISTGREPTLNA